MDNRLYRDDLHGNADSLRGKLNGGCTDWGYGGGRPGSTLCNVYQSCGRRKGIGYDLKLYG